MGGSSAFMSSSSLSSTPLATPILHGVETHLLALMVNIDVGVHISWWSHKLDRAW